MVTNSNIQDRTAEFRAVLAQAKRKKKGGRIGEERQTLLSKEAQRNESPVGEGGPRRRAPKEFARRAAEIGRAISGTTQKLQRLAQLARRKTLFDDRPVEISELTYVIKQDLASINSQISSLQGLSKAQQPQKDEGEHSRNVVVLLQGKLADVGVNFKDILEARTQNIQDSRNRRENFVSSVSAASLQSPDHLQSASPLYSTPTKSPTPSPGYANSDLLNLEPSAGLPGSATNAEQQMLLLEEGQSNTYINQRGEAIEAIERTINELGGIFGQLAEMVSAQGNQIERIDADTEDVVANVEGAQREL
ncbi:cis-Golgi t-SNARE syntaxin [Thelotrema lepadinum]|nr:cis-Golgi t-SNARE syntaxin [Thelotrema lepadinum]